MSDADYMINDNRFYRKRGNAYYYMLATVDSPYANGDAVTKEIKLYYANGRVYFDAMHLHGITHNMMCELGDLSYSLENADFVDIVDGAIHYYGGDQKWFGNHDNSMGRIAGCGTVAAANIFAYFSMSDSKYKNLYNYQNYSMENYVTHMYDVYNYINPTYFSGISVPNSGYSIAPVEDHFTPIGIYSIDNLVSMVEAYTAAKNIALSAVKFSDRYSWNLENAYHYISEGLKKNKPIALLNTFNWWLRNIEYVNHDGETKTNSFETHWVTITGMTGNPISGKINIEVSTWGTKVTLDLMDIVKGLYGKGMVYFE